MVVGEVHNEEHGGRDCDKLIRPVNKENEGSSGRMRTGGCNDVVDETTIISGKDRMISGIGGGARWAAW